MAATTADGKKVVGEMITLVSSDGKRFDITREAAAMSHTIHHHMIEIPLPNVTSKILAMVIEYCNKHVAGSDTSDEQEDLKSFDAKFMEVDQATLFDIIIAANYLDINGLLELSSQTVAGMIKGKSVEEIRATFNIVNDSTPEKEAEVPRENKWAFSTNPGPGTVAFQRDPWGTDLSSHPDHSLSSRGMSSSSRRSHLAGQPTAGTSISKITEDGMSKIEEAKEKICKLEESKEKRNNVGNERMEMEQVLIELVEAVKKVVFLLKCVIFLVVLFGSVLSVRNLLNM